MAPMTSDEAKELFVLTNLYIDIETIPTQRDDLKQLVNKKVRPPKTMTKADTIAQWYNSDKYIEACNEAWEKTALNGLFGEIVAIAWRWDDETAVHSVMQNIYENEGEMLDGFFALISEQKSSKYDQWVTWIGHNITGFDLPFILHRCIVNGVTPPHDVYLPRRLRPTGNKGVFDTMTEWSGWGKRVSLDDMAMAFGLEGKNGSGSQVWRLVEEGRWDDLRHYVEQDVNVTRNVYIKMQSLLGGK